MSLAPHVATGSAMKPGTQVPSACSTLPMPSGGAIPDRPAINTGTLTHSIDAVKAPCQVPCQHTSQPVGH